MSALIREDQLSQHGSKSDLLHNVSLNHKSRHKLPFQPLAKPEICGLKLLQELDFPLKPDAQYEFTANMPSELG